MITAFLRLAGLSLLAIAALAACGRAEADPFRIESAVESERGGPRPELAIRGITDVNVAPALQNSETRRVFRTAGEFRSFFGVAPPADVDFAHEWIGFYSAGARADHGAEAVIESVRPSLGGTMLLVTTRLRTLGSECIADPSATPRFTLVAFRAPDPAPRTTRFYSAATPTACPRPDAPALDTSAAAMSPTRSRVRAVSLAKRETSMHARRRG